MHYERAPRFRKRKQLVATGAALSGYIAIAKLAFRSCAGKKVLGRGRRRVAPAPPGFGALVPVPMRGLYSDLIEKGCRSIPLDGSRPTESALGLLPSMALFLRSAHG